MEFIHLLQSNGINVKIFRCDNAAENEKFKENDTPHQDGVVERAFATVYGRVQKMLNYANIEGEIRKSL